MSEIDYKKLYEDTTNSINSLKERKAVLNASIKSISDELGIEPKKEVIESKIKEWSTEKLTLESEILSLVEELEKITVSEDKIDG